jgi:hypothetical protein
MIQAAPTKLFDLSVHAKKPALARRASRGHLDQSSRSFKSVNYFLLLEEEVSPLFTVVSCPGFFVVVVLPWLLP